MRPDGGRRRRRRPEGDDPLEVGDMADLADRAPTSRLRGCALRWRTALSPRRHVAAWLVLFMVSGCAGGSATSVPSLVAVSAAPSMVPVSPAAAASQASASARPSSSVIVGSWTRVQSCQAMRAAFIKAGLADQVQSLVVPNFVPQGAAAPSGHECDNAGAPVAHTHFFTADGRFGSRDQNGQQVDDGDYVLVDDRTLSFPSHARDFDFAGSILVGFTVTADTMNFKLQIPDHCEGACRVAYGWALSAFYGPTPFQRSGG